MRFLDRVRRRTAPLDPGFGPLIGDLAGPVARIAPDGTVATLDGSWRVEWGVLAGTDWRRASEQAAVRQNRIDDTPVYETWMRVPGGDVIQRVGVVNDGDGRAFVIEYENASPEAVVVAAAGFVPGTLDAELAGVRLDGTSWIRPSVDAGAVAAGSGIWEQIEAEPTTASATGTDAVALLVPVPHRQSIRLLVGIEGDLPARSADPVEVAAGWRAVTGAALTVDVPDVDLAAAWRRVLGDLVLAAADDDPVAAGEAAWWLDLAGLPAEADRGRARVLDAADRGALSSDGAVVALRALASSELRHARPSALAETAGPLARLAGDRLDRTTVALVAAALEQREPDVAADAAALAARLPERDRPFASPVAAGAARVLGHLFRDADLGGADAGPRVEMLPSVPESWFGQSIDVRGMVTGLGTLSFSVRWHGERPAVLWERVGGPDDAELVCPGLDPQWSSRTRSGEALLAAPGADPV